MSVKCQEDIVELQVTVDDAVLVEVLECQANFRRVELRSLGAELAALDVQHQITARDVLHDEVDPSLGLKAGMQVGEERVALLVRNEEDPLLGACALDFVVLDDELLLEHLDGVKLFPLLGLCQHNLTEVTLAQHSQEVEVIETNATTGASRIRRWCRFSLLDNGCGDVGWRLLWWQLLLCRR